MRFSQFLNQVLESEIDKLTGDGEDAPAEDTPEKKSEDKPTEITDFKSLFDANKDGIKDFVHIETYDAKLLDKDTVIIANGKRTKAPAGSYVLRRHDDIKKFVIVSEKDFDAMYEPVRPSEKKDAEGFILVKQIGDIEGFELKGEAVSFNGEDGDTVDVKPNDYVLRNKGEDDSGWVIKPAEFRKAYKEKK